MVSLIAFILLGAAVIVLAATAETPRNWAAVVLALAAAILAALAHGPLHG